MQEEEAISSSSGEDVRVSAVKRKQRTELNPTMVKAFKTEDGAAEWTSSIVKSFAIEQVYRCCIPQGAEILMFQPELTTKKSTGEKKARLVVNGKQESIKEGENNYSPTSLSKSLHKLLLRCRCSRRSLDQGY